MTQLSSMCTRNRVMFVVICFTLIMFFFLSMYLTPWKVMQNLVVKDDDGKDGSDIPAQQSDITNPKDPRYPTTFDSMKRKMKTLASFIYKAKQHVRGSKTSDFLKQAIETMNSLLVEANINPMSIYNRTTREPVHVCPEKYMGGKYGYPFFETGFEVIKCEHNVPIWKLVTILKTVNSAKKNKTTVTEHINRFVASVVNVHTNINIIVSIGDKDLASTVKDRYPAITVIDPQKMSEGKTLNKMAKNVKTPYIFVSRNMQFLTNDSRFESLVRAVESLDVKVAGGAFRNPEGHWKKGCFQSVYRNFTLKYLEGYDESKHECLFCDFIEGPFIAAKDLIIQNGFEDLSSGGGLFEDWFLKLSTKGVETIVCPDSMFHILDDHNNDTSHLEKFMKKWNLFKFVSTHGDTVIQKCHEETVKKTRSKALSPCSIQSNSYAVKTVMEVCESANIYCELLAGTIFGPLKLGKILPWEWDADLRILTANYTAFKNLKDTFSKRGLNFRSVDSRKCCSDGINRTTGGEFYFPYRGWLLEMHGLHTVDSATLVENGMNPTKILLEGQWVNVPRNPGLHIKNKYGPEIYQHAEHWRNVGMKAGWSTYTPNIFQPCSNKGSHDCLDRYNADGDLPFIIMLP